MWVDAPAAGASQLAAVYTFKAETMDPAFNAPGSKVRSHAPGSTGEQLQDQREWPDTAVLLKRLRPCSPAAGCLVPLLRCARQCPQQKSAGTNPYQCLRLSPDLASHALICPQAVMLSGCLI